MKTRINLYGALREADPAGHVELDVPTDCSVAELRRRLMQHLAEHAPGIAAGLVKRSAFANDETILHDANMVPVDAELAILPPVSGG